jgi:hypothetical protein
VPIAVFAPPDFGSGGVTVHLRHFTIEQHDRIRGAGHCRQRRLTTVHSVNQVPKPLELFLRNLAIYQVVIDDQDSRRGGGFPVSRHRRSGRSRQFVLRPVKDRRP